MNFSSWEIYTPPLCASLMGSMHSSEAGGQGCSFNNFWSSDFFSCCSFPKETVKQSQEIIWAKTEESCSLKSSD